MNKNMMQEKSKSIVVPGSYFVARYDWALEATGQNQVAAEVLAVFLFHHDNRNGNRILVELVDRAIYKNRHRLITLDTWIPYSWSYLIECLLNAYARSTIIEATKLLVKIGFVSTDVPDRIKNFYSKSHSWFKVEIPAIRHWIKTVWENDAQKPSIYANNTADIHKAIHTISAGDSVAVPIDSPFKQRIAEKRTVKDAEIAKAKADRAAKAEKRRKATEVLGKFYRHIHGKSAAFIYDKKRQMLVKRQIVEREKVLGLRKAVTLCAMAILGNVKSDFHQGRHPDNTLGVIGGRNSTMGRLYDDIGAHIFKDSAQVDKMLSYAENAGITEEIAFEQFKNFVEGKPSPYAKNTEKTDKELRKEARTEAHEKYRIEANMRHKYKAFSFAIAGFFKNGDVSNQSIIELYETNAAIKQNGRGLTNADYLTDCLMFDGKTKFGNVSDAQAKQMKEFAAEFCKLQEKNNG